MMDAAMDFKAALLKSQPGVAATASVFKPTAGDANTANGKAQDARAADSFHASGDEGRSNAVKVEWPLSSPLKATDVGSTSACATALVKDVISTPVHYHLRPCSTSICYLQL